MLRIGEFSKLSRISIRMLRHYDDPEELSKYLQVKQLERRELADLTNRRIQLLETAVERLRKDGTAMKYDVILKEMPKRTAR